MTLGTGMIASRNLDYKYPSDHISIKNSDVITGSSHRKALTNQYSVLNKYKKVDQFLDMEKYFSNLYGEKKQKRMT
jgi:hypothetical protein